MMMMAEEEVSVPRVHGKFVAANLIAVFLGTAIGVLLKVYCNVTEEHLEYIDFPGRLLLQLLQSVTVPMIVSSVVTGVIGLSMEATWKITSRAMAYFAITTILAVLTGLVLVQVLEPGVQYAGKGNVAEDESLFLFGALVELLLNLFPANPLRACYQQYKLEIIEVPGDGPDPSDDPDVEVKGYFVHGANILGLIVYSLILGLGLIHIGEKEGPIARLMIIVNIITKKYFNLYLWYMPVGIMFMIITHLVEEHDWESPMQLAKFMGVVLLGLAIHGFVTLPLFYFLCTRQNPFLIFKGVTPALLSAIVISSSSATLPQTFQCCEERLNLDKRVSRFMLPIGTNINMNGTALYEVVAAIFIAQLNHIRLSLNQIITILVTAALSSIGAAGIPATGAMTTIIVMSAAGLPAKEAAILVGIEWLLDRFNTVINVYGDCMGVALVHAVSQKDLEMMDAEAEARAEPRENNPTSSEDNYSTCTSGEMSS